MSLCNPSTIHSLLEKHGSGLEKSLGQNFLIRPEIPQRIAAESRITSNDGVLEIGPGIGCLTVCLSAQARKVVCVELDRRLEPILAETLADCNNTEVVFGDALRLDLPSICSERMTGLPLHVCANIPYYITTPLITRLVEFGCFRSLTLMIQKEVARRICAGPGNGDYGAFSVYCAYYSAPEILFDVSAGCFMPRPKVDSSVVHLQLGKRLDMGENEDLFFKLVRAGFGQRRKTLRNSLSGVIPGKHSSEEVLERAGIAPNARAEELSLENFAALTEAAEYIITKGGYDG